MLERYDIQKLQDLPIEQVAEALGLQVSHHKALCPFHADKHPSLTFHRGRNRYRCFVCDARGGTIDLVMRYLNKSFLEACKWLSEEHSIPVVSVAEPVEAPKPFNASRYERFFERPFLSQEARTFLFNERKLDPRVVRWCCLTSWRDKQGVPWLQTPYYSREGKLIGIQNRNLAYGSKFKVQGSSEELPQPSSLNSQPSSAPRFRFPSGAQCGIYNLPVLNLLKPGEPLFLTEGCSDCWSMLSAGHKAIAIPSATLLSRKDEKVLGALAQELGTPFHIFPDQDAPGEQLYNRLVEASVRYGFTLLRHQLPAGCKDFSDLYLQKHLNPSTLNSHPSTGLFEPSC